MNSADASIREQLEQLYQQSPSISVRFQFQEFFRAVWRSVRERIAGDPTQPRISRYFDITGTTIWHAYDPISHLSFTSKSEAELLDWLEERYSHRPQVY